MVFPHDYIYNPKLTLPKQGRNIHFASLPWTIFFPDVSCVSNVSIFLICLTEQWQSICFVCVHLSSLRKMHFSESSVHLCGQCMYLWNLEKSFKEVVYIETRISQSVLQHPRSESWTSILSGKEKKSVCSLTTVGNRYLVLLPCKIHSAKI